MTAAARPAKARASLSTTAVTIGGVGMLDLAVFLLLLALLCVRPLMTEAFHGDSSLVPRTPGGPTPDGIAALDTLLLALAGLALGRRPAVGRVGAAFLICLALLVAAAIISTAAANEKRPAMNSAANLVITIAAAGALAGLMSARWMITLAIAATLATGVVTSWRCISQVTHEFRDTQEYWLQHKAELLKSQGREPDDPEVINFERRMASREAFGYLSHPNVAGECLAMWLTAAAGVLAGIVIIRRRGSDPAGVHSRPGEPAPASPGAAAAIMTMAGGLMAAALWFTHSAGALVGAVCGIAALVVLGTQTRLPARPRLLVAAFAAAYLACVAAGATYGVLKGALPHPSMAFRWHYWSAAGAAWLDAPLTGVGRENFVSAYVLHKPAESPEEVQNPHNLWVTLLVELGPLGLIAVAALLLIWLTVAIGRMGSMAGRCAGLARADLTAAAPAVLVPMLALAHVAFGRPDGLYVGNVNAALFWLLEIVVLWTLALAAVAAAMPAGAGRWLQAGLIAAILGAMIHNLVGFSLTTPAGLSIAAVLAATAVPRGESPASAALRPGSRIATWVLVALAWVAQVFLILVPVALSEKAMAAMRTQLADAATSSDAGNAVLIAEKAVAFDRWDSDAPARVAAVALQVSNAAGIPADDRLRWQQRALRNAQLAAQRASRTAGHFRLLGSVQAALAQTLLDAGRKDEAHEALRAAARAWDRAVELYPTHARSRMQAGIAWFTVWQYTSDAPAAQRAVAELRTAIEMDARHPPEEVIRLRRKELNEIDAHLQQLRGSGFDP